MRKSLDQLAKNLASGMSRRKALWGFVSGLGLVATLTGRKAEAGILGNCAPFCAIQAETFLSMCIEASRSCGSGYCAEFSLIGFNGSYPIGISMNNTYVSSPSSPFVCVPTLKVLA